jgi:cyclopropane fatty-acyl-phospholipid synthase-like methyltransferase
MSTYTESFYNQISAASRSAAQEIVPSILEMINPQSVIDVGCGVGSFLSVFKQNGVEDIFGVDGNWVDQKLLEIPSEKFLPVNLEKPIPVDRQFDLVMSIEVAEHIPHQFANTFIDSLVSLGKVCLFSAAIPRQGGLHHVNEQWPEYWIGLFQARGYVVIDCIRKKFWNNQKLAWWYKQNFLLFVQQAHLQKYPLLVNEFNKNTLQFSLVHPEVYRKNHRNKASIDVDKSTLKTDPRLPYSDAFYQGLKTQSQSAAENIVPLVMKLVNPKKVVDIGCGTGSWLSVFKKQGVESILGVDGEWVKKWLEIPVENFVEVDLEQNWKINDKFDLAVSLAVAEHLPINIAESFVGSLVNLAPVCLFSAAIPGQGGLNHFNEQWLEYWVKLFRDRGYIVVDCLRSRVWNNQNVAWWYSQSLVMFVEEKCLSNYPLLEIELEKNESSGLSIVHPLIYFAKSKK